MKNCYFYLLYKRKGDDTTQIPIDMNDAQHRSYDSETDTITVSFEPDSYFTNKNGSVDIQVFACNATQDFSTEDVDIEDVAVWTTFNTQIAVAKSQIQDSQTIISEDLFTKEIEVLASYLDSAEGEADDAEMYASDAEEFAKGTRSDGLTVPHASTGAHDNAKDYKDLAKDWASKIGGAVESGEYSAKYYAVVSDTRSQEAEAYALGTKGGTPAPAFADKNAKDWATKTGSTVDGTNYSSKQYALNSKDYADIVSAHATAIDAIGDDLTNIDAVATDILDEDSAIDTVATNIADVTTVAGNTTNINTVAGKATEITTVAGISSNVTTVAGISSDVTAVAGIASDVSAVEDIKTDVSAVASIDTDVSAVATIASDVSAVADIDGDISTVATNISDINDVADDLTKIDSVADDLTNIDAVADDLTNIDAVAAEIPNLGLKENVSNKVTSISSSSTDTQYPSAKAVYTADTDLKNAIDSNTARIENLEQEHGSLVPVQYRGTNAVPSGKAKYAMVESIVGKSRGWNQLVNNSQLSTVTDHGVTFTKNADGSWTLSGTATGGDASIAISQIMTPTVGHYYLTSGCPSGGSGSTYMLYGTGGSGFSDIGSGSISHITASTTTAITILIREDVNATGLVFRPILRDLTLIFPEGVPSTVAEAVALCPSILEYDAYGYSLVDTVVEGVESRFVNMFDYTDIQAFQACSLSNGVIKNTNADALSYFAPQFQFFNGGTYVGSSAMSSTGYTGTYNGTFTTPNAPFTIVRFKHNGGSVDIFVNYNNSDIGLEQGKTYSMNMYILGANPSVVGGLSWKDMQICSNDLDASIKNVYHAYHAPSTLSLPAPVTLRSAGSVADTDELNVEVSGVAKRRQTTRVGTDTVSINSIYERSTNPNCNFALFQMQEFIKNWSNTMVAGCSVSSDGWDSVSKEGELLIYDTGSRLIAISIGKSVTLATAQATYNGRAIRFDLITESVTLSDPISNCMVATEGGGTINTIQTQTPVIDNCLDVGYLTL